MRVQTTAARLQSGTTFAKEFGNSLKGSLLGIVGPAALATAAIGAIVGTAQKLEQAFVFKAQLDATTNSVKSQLQGFRDVNATYNEAIRFGQQYNITQQETAAILSSSTDILRTSTASVTELETALIRLQSKSPEKPISEASRALRELASGDTTSIKELFQIPARDANKMKAEILAGGDAVKVLTAYLNDAKVGMGALEQRTQGAMGKMNELKVAQEQYNIALAGGAGGAGLAILETRIRYLQDATFILTGNFKGMWAAAEAGHEGNVAEMEAYNAAIAAGKTDTEARTAAAAAGAAAEQNYVAWIENSSNAQSQYSGAALQSAAATYQSADAEDRRAAATGAAAVGLNAESVALAEQTQKSLDASLQAQELARFQEQLASIGGAVAGGFSTASEGAVALAKKYDIAYDAALKLINAQAALANAANLKAALQLQRHGERSPGESGQAEFDDLENRRLQQLYRSLQDPTPKAPKAPRGGGGGRLSDQQKLNNSLLADQDKANDKFEDAQIKHEQDLLKIERDFQQKSLDAQKKNESDKRRSRFDFYKNLSKDTATIGQAAAADLSAQYEAAFAESQRLAQAGNQQQAREFLALRKEQIAADQDYYRDRAEAQKQAKDGESKAERDAAQAEIGRLDSLRALEKDAQAEDLKQLLEGGDQLQNDKASALQNENAQYEQSQSKIELASDRATDHKITNAQRAGKAIEAENALLVKQGQILQSLPGGSGAVPTNGALPATADTPAAAGAAAAALMAVVDTALLGAVQAQTSMQIEKFDAVIGRLDAVERAVRSVRGMGSVAA